jgi:hypothetical protein
VRRRSSAHDYGLPHRGVEETIEYGRAVAGSDIGKRLWEKRRRVLADQALDFASRARAIVGPDVGLEVFVECLGKGGGILRLVPLEE